MALLKIREPRGSLGAAFAAGILGSGILTILGSLSRATGWLPEMSFFNIEMILGSFLTGNTGSAGTWLLGFAWHLVNGGLFGLLYAAGFRALGRSGIGIGAAFGIVHAVLVLIAMGPMAAVDVNPVTALAALLGHLLFGATVGGLYHLTVRSRTSYVPPEEEQPLRRIA